jgi:hypothetical protein
VYIHISGGKPGDILRSEPALDDEHWNEIEANVVPNDAVKEDFRGVRSFEEHNISTHAGRLHLASLLPSLLSHRRTIIPGCGPENQKIDLPNTAAKLQSRVSSDDADEMVLHTETYGW